MLVNKFTSSNIVRVAVIYLTGFPWNDYLLDNRANSLLSDIMMNKWKTYCLIFHIPRANFKGVGVFGNENNSITHRVVS